jgi:hypothetical protein
MADMVYIFKTEIKDRKGKIGAAIFLNDIVVSWKAEEDKTYEYPGS